MTCDPDNFFVSTDSALLDLDFICSELHQSYWAKNRPRPVIERAIANSLCFGLYEMESGKQIGFARVVTDSATFAWLCDVMITEPFRGKGLGKLLMSAVVEHPSVANYCLLGTDDAHGFYEQFGFQRCEQMRRCPSRQPPIDSATG